MSNNENLKAQEEELKKLEEEAYFELCQIIAEAIELQDIKILNTRLSAWKTKYKKLLDGSTPNSALIQKIKLLQSDNYIGYIINLIMQRITIKEHVKINNQLKAISQLYSIIKETNDLQTLENKVKEWNKKYPTQSFMNMYQNKVKYYTSSRYLKQNAFDQATAFDDLVQVAKIDKPEEIKEAFKKWEETYQINDKFKLDDFIKNQSEVKRYVEEINQKANASQLDEENIPQRTVEQFSDITKQKIAFSSLMAILQNPDNLNKVFEWVHKHCTIKFDDTYKSLILSRISKYYSPAYLTQLPVPNINVLKSSLTLEEYAQINDIKRYAVISYFNLLLPEGKSYSNNFFTTYVEDIYYKSKNLKIRDAEILKSDSEPLKQETETPIVESQPITSHGEKNLEIKLDVVQENTDSHEQTDLNDIQNDFKNNIKEEDKIRNLDATSEEIIEPAPDLASEASIPEIEIDTDNSPKRSEQDDAEIVVSANTIQEKDEPENEPELETELKTKSEYDLKEENEKNEPETTEPVVETIESTTHSIPVSKEPEITTVTNTISENDESKVEITIDTIQESKEPEAIEEPEVTVVTNNMLENNEPEIEITDTPEDNDHEDNNHEEITITLNENPDALVLDLNTPNTTWDISSDKETDSQIETSDVTEEIEQNEENREEIDTIVYSPLFFDMVNSLSVQADLIQSIDDNAEKSIKTRKIKSYSKKTYDDLQKNKLDN